MSKKTQKLNRKKVKRNKKLYITKKLRISKRPRINKKLRISKRARINKKTRITRKKRAGMFGFNKSNESLKNTQALAALADKRAAEQLKLSMPHASPTSVVPTLPTTRQIPGIFPTVPTHKPDVYSELLEVKKRALAIAEQSRTAHKNDITKVTSLDSEIAPLKAHIKQLEDKVGIQDI